MRLGEVFSYSGFFVFLGIIAVSATSCSNQPEPEKDVVAVYELPKLDESDKENLLILIGEMSRSEELHTRSDPRHVGQSESSADPSSMITTRAGFWRSSHEELPELAVLGISSHPDTLWLMFRNGGDAKKASQYRERLVVAIEARWPNIHDVQMVPGIGDPPSPDEFIN